METSVAHQTDKSRFVIMADGQEAGYAAYLDTDKTREFTHTVIDEEFQGKGLSKLLIGEALDETRAAGKQVIATCSAVAGFIEKNPAYQDLLEAR